MANNATGSTCACSGSLLYKPTTQTCVSCASQIDHCQTCGYLGGSYSPSAPTAIVCVTPKPGYYVLANGTTEACIPNCNVCSDSVTCTTCNPTFSGSGTTNCYCDNTVPVYLLTNSTCGTCPQAVGNCSSCTVLGNGTT